MNDTTNPQEINPQELTPDEAAASLALAIRLSEQMLPKASQEPQNAPGSDETPETIKGASEDEIATIVKEEVAKSVKKEIGELRKELKEMLADEQD